LYFLFALCVNGICEKGTTYIHFLLSTVELKASQEDSLNRWLNARRIQESEKTVRSTTSRIRLEWVTRLTWGPWAKFLRVSAEFLVKFEQKYRDSLQALS
jgi:hypothetical protein